MKKIFKKLSNTLYIYAIYFIAQFIHYTAESIYLIIVALNFKKYKLYIQYYNAIKKIPREDLKTLLLKEKIYLSADSRGWGALPIKDRIESFYEYFTHRFENINDKLTSREYREKLTPFLNRHAEHKADTYGIIWPGLFIAILINVILFKVPWLTYLLWVLLIFVFLEFLWGFDLSPDIGFCSQTRGRRGTERSEYITQLLLKHDIVKNKSHKTYILRWLAIRKTNLPKIIHKSIQLIPKTPQFLKLLFEQYLELQREIISLVILVHTNKTRNPTDAIKLGISKTEHDLFTKNNLYGYVDIDGLENYINTISVRQKIDILERIASDKKDKIEQLFEISFTTGVLIFCIFIFSIAKFHYLIYALVFSILCLRGASFFGYSPVSILYKNSEKELVKQAIIKKLTKDEKLKNIYKFELLLEDIARELASFESVGLGIGKPRGWKPAGLIEMVEEAQHEEFQPTIEQAYELIKPYFCDDKMFNNFRRMANQYSSHKQQELTIIEYFINRFEATLMHKDWEDTKPNTTPKKPKKI